MLTICIILIVLLALDLLFTLALRCRKGHRKWEVLKKYRYAHRGYHDKPVGLLNVENYYTSMLQFLQSTVTQGFMGAWQMDLIKADSDIAALMQFLVESAGLVPESKDLRHVI